jgi:aryl-alcohol dehydrogenase-like predicted oxidoreductase
VIDQPGVTTVIPGARNPSQARANAAAASLPPLSDELQAQLARVYDERVREYVHNRW